MAMTYHKAYKVPLWIVVREMAPERLEVVNKWLAGAEALPVEWPGKTFPKALLEWRNKGYAHALPEFPFTLDTTLLLRAAAEHVKNVISPTSLLAGSVNMPTNRLDRRVLTEGDLSVIFNDLLSLEDPVALSQIFQVAERCHNENAKRTFAWVSHGPGVPKALLTRLADRVITIGDEQTNDLVVDCLEQEQLVEKLEDFFQQN